MSEVKEAQQESAQPSQADLVKFLQFKNQMIQQLNANYKAFMDSLRTVPVMQGALNISMQHFETGLVWMEKGISLVPFEAVQAAPVTPSQPQATEVVAEVQSENPSVNVEESNAEPLDAA